MEIKKYSLLCVGEYGYSWIQNFVGTIEEAKTKSNEIKKVNNNRFNIVVVNELSSVVPQGYVPSEIVNKILYTTDPLSSLNE